MKIKTSLSLEESTIARARKVAEREDRSLSYVLEKIIEGVLATAENTDSFADAVKKLEGATGAASLEEAVAKLAAPRTVWVMLPAGKITEETIAALGGLLSKGDVIIDGGNTMFKDDIRRARNLREKGITYLDVGTSGGVWGLERGYCMMIGGEKETVDRLDPIFAALCPGEGDIPKTPGRETCDPRVARGYMHAGPAGSGHFATISSQGRVPSLAHSSSVTKGMKGCSMTRI